MKAFLVLLACILAGCQRGAHSDDVAAESPYRGRQDRTLKALSDERIEGLLDGQGLGYARAAELNGYPGPRHVLDLADSLRLTPQQTQQVTESFDKMQRSARALGSELVAREQRLDSLFATGNIVYAELRALASEIGRTESELRYVHLAAHLETEAMLTEAQVAIYNRLRGYLGDNEHGDGADHTGHDSHGM